MLPIHSKDKEFKPGWRIRQKLLGWLRVIFSDPASRNLFLFLLLNLSMAFVELMYGVWTNSLGLISDSFHMFFDCTALLAGLAASVISKWRADDRFSYGYVRAEVLAGFVNGLFLVFIAFFIFSEAVERVVEPPEVEHEKLFLVSVIGFIVNLVGIFVFQHGHAHGDGAHGHSHGGSSHSHSVSGSSQGQNNDSHGHSHNNSSHGHSHRGSNHGHSHGLGLGNEPSHEEGETATSSQTQIASSSQTQIMQGVFLHILADTLGSVGVIISSFLIEHFGLMIADPICSMFISVLIGISVVPLLRDSTGILMQRQPRDLDNVLPGCYHRVGELEGVFSVQDPHFWTLCSDVYIGTIKVEVAQNADVTYIQSQTHNIFTAAGVRQLYVQIDHAPM